MTAIATPSPDDLFARRAARIKRALAVWEATVRPFTRWPRQGPPRTRKAARRGHCIAVALASAREGIPAVAVITDRGLAHAHRGKHRYRLTQRHLIAGDRLAHKDLSGRTDHPGKVRSYEARGRAGVDTQPTPRNLTAVEGNPCALRTAGVVPALRSSAQLASPREIGARTLARARHPNCLKPRVEGEIEGPGVPPDRAPMAWTIRSVRD